MLLQLLCAGIGEFAHIVLGAKVQASGGAGLDAGRLQAFGNAVGAQSAFINTLGFFVEFGNVEGAPGNAVAAADAIILLKIDDAVGVLHDGAVGRTGFKATRVGAVHALIFAHQPHERAVFPLVLVEQNQVPVIPAGLRHGLISVVEDSFAKG